MGKGDKKTRKGKITMGSYGVLRPRKKIAKKADSNVETTKKVATPKKAAAPKKEATAKKAAPKKAAKKAE